jgi:hypothetical protein
MWQFSWGSLAYACNPSYSGGRDQILLIWNQTGQIVLWDSISKKPFTKKGWWSGSSCRPWVQVPVPQKKRKRMIWPFKNMSLTPFFTFSPERWHLCPFPFNLGWLWLCRRAAVWLLRLAGWDRDIQVKLVSVRCSVWEKSHTMRQAQLPGACSAGESHVAYPGNSLSEPHLTATTCYPLAEWDTISIRLVFRQMYSPLVSDYNYVRALNAHSNATKAFTDSYSKVKGLMVAVLSC